MAGCKGEETFLANTHIALKLSIHLLSSFIMLTIEIDLCYYT